MESLVYFSNSAHAAGKECACTDFLTKLLSHSALRCSYTTALQQLPEGDHGGRIKSQMKGSACGERTRSARVKYLAAILPQRSARPSWPSDAEEKQEQTALIKFK